jgi:hypothetical protein
MTASQTLQKKVLDKLAGCLLTPTLFKEIRFPRLRATRAVIVVSDAFF